MQQNFHEVAQFFSPQQDLLISSGYEVLNFKQQQKNEQLDMKSKPNLWATVNTVTVLWGDSNYPSKHIKFKFLVHSYGAGFTIYCYVNFINSVSSYLPLLETHWSIFIACIALHEIKGCSNI